MKTDFQTASVRLKLWAEREEWEKIQGTKEAVITKVSLLNSAGEESAAFAPGESLLARCRIYAQEKVKEPHFGVAIFREDGLYCFGPNTLFDKREIKVLEKGEGFFSARFKSLNLAPGDYRVSVAIWDKKEVLAYSYHPALYKFRITGANPCSLLACYRPQWRLGDAQLPDDCRAWSGFDPKVLTRDFKNKSGNQSSPVSQVEIADAEGVPKAAFDLGSPVTLRFRVDSALTGKKFILAAGLFRRDGLLVHASFRALTVSSEAVAVLYRDLNLLRGKYTFSIALWAEGSANPLFCHYGACFFEIKTDKPDHGCLFFEHDWQLCLP